MTATDERADLIARCDRAAAILTASYPPGTPNGRVGFFARRLAEMARAGKPEARVRAYLERFEGKIAADAATED